MFRQNYVGGGSPLFGGLGVAAGPPSSNFQGKRKDTAFTPRFSISFKPDASNSFYASYAQGFKGGGFDLRGVSAAAKDTNNDGVRGHDEIYNSFAFKPEKVTTEEVGYKASLFDRRVYTALVIFSSDYKNVQIPASVGVVVNGVATFAGATTNAAKARIRGVEWEGTARLAGDPAGTRLNLGWSVGYLNAKYRKFLTDVLHGQTTGLKLPSPGVTVDVAAFRKIQNTPKWTASGTLSLTHPFGNGEEIDVSTTLSYRSSSQQFELRIPGLDQEGFALLDANLVYTGPDYHWMFGVHARNLTDKRYISSSYNFLRHNPFTGNLINLDGTPGIGPALGKEGVLTAYYDSPRQLFFSVGYKF